MNLMKFNWIYKVEFKLGSWVEVVKLNWGYEVEFKLLIWVEVMKLSWNYEPEPVEMKSQSLNKIIQLSLSCEVELILWTGVEVITFS